MSSVAPRLSRYGRSSPEPVGLRRGDPAVADDAVAAEPGPAGSACPGCGAPLDGPELLRGHDRMMHGPGEFAVVSCVACGLASTLPRLRPEQFADYYPDTYNAYRGERSWVERARLEAIAHFGPYRTLLRRPPGRLLDVGCGTGDLALTFAHHGWQVSGVEPAAAACGHAVAAGIEMHCGTLADAPWRGPTFDAIVFNHSLEHVPDPEATLRQAASLLRTGGMVAIGVPNFGCWQRRVFGACWFQLDLPRHLQHFDAGTLDMLVERAGLRAVAWNTSSMRPSILLSLQYATFGRARWTGRGLRLAAWAIAPLLWLLDLTGTGDCVHVFAVQA